MNIDESDINDSMVKVIFLSSELAVDENGDEVTDIVIKINDEKQQLPEGEKLEEIDDFPMTYEDSIVMSENIPQSIDVNDLQDLRYFSIDEFWHSLGYRYVYYIYKGDGG